MGKSYRKNINLRTKIIIYIKSIFRKLFTFINKLFTGESYEIKRC